MKTVLACVAILLPALTPNALADDFERLAPTWQSDPVHTSVWLRTKALGRALKAHRTYLNNLHPSPPVPNKSLATIQSELQEALRLTCEDAIPLLEKSPDHTVAWWLMFYFGDRVPDPSDEWCETIRRLCITLPETAARIRHELESEDYENLERAALKMISSDRGETEQVEAVRALLTSLPADQYAAKYKTQKARD